MTYQEYLKESQDAFDKLPIFWAFSDEQFEKAMNKRGLSVEDTDKVCRLSMGGFCLKADLPVVKAHLEKPDPLPELMKNFDFARDAIYYEMCNHEYGINWEGDYDVCSCFGQIEWRESDVVSYFKQLGWSDETRRAYLIARRDYWKAAEEGGWF